jgi:DNA-binding FadR family transcriptional regulator
MKSLAAKGLVSIGPRVGTHVLPRARWNLFDPTVLGWHSGPSLDEKLIADLMELRRAIEPLAARLAAERGTAAEVESVRSAYLAMKGAKGGADYIAADLRFHGAVVRACGNQFILQLENALAAVWKTSFEASSDAWGADSEALALHETLLNAIETHDGAAAEAAVLALIGRATVRIRGAAL